MQTTVTLKEMVCGGCSIHYAMDQALYSRCLTYGDTFYCPNGHPRVFIDPEVSKLKKENQSLKNRALWAEQDSHRHYEELAAVKKEKAVIKGQLTKTRKRIANGVCPCCRRTFQNVSSHMTSKHPDFKEVVG